MNGLLSQLFRVIRLGSGGVVGGTRLEAAKMWHAGWRLVGLLLVLLIADWAMKVYLGLDSACGVVFFGVVLLTLYVTPAPTLLSAAFGFGLFNRAEGRRRFQGGVDAVEGYLEHFVGNALLWTSVVAIVIWLLPIENNPRAFWIGLALLIVSELTIWKGWEVAPRRGKRIFVIVLQAIFVYTLLSTFPPVWLRTMYLPVDLFHSSMSAESHAKADLDTKLLADKKKAECMKTVQFRLNNNELPSKDDWEKEKECENKVVVYAPPDPQPSGNSPTRIVTPDVVSSNLMPIIVAITLIGILIYLLTRKSGAEGAASKTASSFGKSIGNFFSTWTLPILIIWGIGSIINGSAIGPADIAQWWDKPAAASMKPTFPEHMMTPKEAPDWRAYVESPASITGFGDVTGKTLLLVYGKRNGGRPRFDDKLEGGYGKPLLIEFDENDPQKDIVLQDAACNDAQKLADGRVVCSNSEWDGVWSSQILGSGRYRMFIGSDNKRHAVLSDTNGEVMRLLLLPQ